MGSALGYACAHRQRPTQDFPGVELDSAPKRLHTERRGSKLVLNLGRCAKLSSYWRKGIRPYYY